MDNSKADRPERRTALVARELGRYNIDIAALSETRLANEGCLTEVRAGYTFFGVVAAARSVVKQEWASQSDPI